ncbi:hypothetical protein [Amphibacillus jilinensis]|uniref:hypothetical protein n=1 Tax=Amphibacillus jilinensis TaxID=1216008 RepID=UPI000309FB5E|nr:hypothetical protein [Amphibacillus jilinensis]
MNKDQQTRSQEETGENIEIWADLVSIRDLTIAIAITVVTTLVGYFIAPANEPMPLIFGLVGAVIGFIISSIMIKPKRQFKPSGQGGDQ